MSPKPATAPPEDATRTQRYLLVRAGEHVCALPLASVRRVVAALAVKPLPGSADELKGLAEFAGEPLPVLDLARLIGAPPGATPDYPVTIVAWAGPDADRELVGLAADAALEVVEVPVRSIVGGTGGVIAGEVSLRGEPVRAVDLKALGGPA